MNKSIYFFGIDGAEGNSEMKNLLGGKGANLAEMANLELPVPAGFTITTEVCNAYQTSTDQEGFLQDLMEGEVMPAMKKLEEHFGYMPLVSVRSGARVSMPGMMDTILNVGITSDTLDEWKERVGERTALDSYRRLLQMYGDTALGIDHAKFEKHLTEIKSYKYGMKEVPTSDSEMSPKHLKALLKMYESTTQAMTGEEFPDSLYYQLKGSIKAVFDSWNNDRAITYRKMHGYPHDWGTAVNIQAMVFGNANDNSCSGVLFTRNPATGNNTYTGEYLINAQGEDVVAGIRTPKNFDWMLTDMPEVNDELCNFCNILEAHYKDMQDIEFTVQDGILYILQTRNGKRSAEAAFKIAVELVEEGLITKDEALARVNAKQYVVLNKPRLNPQFNIQETGTGIPAGGGIVSGVAVFTSEAATLSIEDCILITKETTPDDIAGMKAAEGILTKLGGLTSHAAVVARGMDKTCVVGCTDMQDEDSYWSLDGVTIKEGDTVTIDGGTGKIWVNVDVDVISSSSNAYADEIIKWVTSEDEDYIERLMVTPEVVIPLGQAKVYLDTVAIEDEEEGLHKFLTYLEESHVSTVFLDLKTKYDYMEDDDMVLWKAFDKEADSNPIINTKIETLTQFSWNTSLKEKTTLFPSPIMTKKDIQALRDSGWKVASKVETMDDLLDADGVIDLSAEFEKSVGGIDSLKSLLKIFEEAGRNLQGVPNAMTKKRRVFDILGAGK